MPQDTNPAALANFTGVKDPGEFLAVKDSGPFKFKFQTTANYLVGTDALYKTGRGRNVRNHVFSIVADRDAMAAIYNTGLDLAQQRLADVVEGAAVSMTYQPVPASMILAGRGEDPTADPFGIDVSRGPYLWIDLNVAWLEAADTPVVEAYMTEVVNAVDQALGKLKRDVKSSFLYLNDAAGTQPVFEGYGATNLARLKRIREKYDPEGTYTYQMPGGWKVALADVQTGVSYPSCSIPSEMGSHAGVQSCELMPALPIEL